MAFFDPEVMKLNEQAARETQDAIDRRWYLEKMWDDEAAEQAAAEVEEAENRSRLETERQMAEEKLKEEELAAASNVTIMQEPEPEEASRELQYGNPPSPEPMMA